MSIDSRSQGNIDTLRAKARPWFAKLYEVLNAYGSTHGFVVKFISGSRTWAEQDELYSHGRNGDTRPRVTNARGGYSNHNYGLAVDIGIFQGANYIPESDHYARMGPLGRAIGLEWGGDWTSPVDKPHYQIKIGLSTAQLRDLVQTQGWAALDARIPTFSATGTGGGSTAPVIVQYDPIEVYLDTTKLSLDAWFDGARSWVNLNDWVDYFGGDLHVQPNNAATIVLSGTDLHLNYATIGGKIAGRFGDVNPGYQLSYSFNGAIRPRRLTIHRVDEP